MTAFRYLARDTSGLEVGGVIGAADRATAASLLMARGLKPVQVTSVRRRRAIRRGELAIAIRSIAELCSAGLPLNRAILVTIPVCSGDCRRLLSAASQRLGEGAPLSRALADPPGAVPPLLLGLLRAGERGSTLGAALDQAASLLEWEAELRARVLHALAYPAVVAVAGAASLALIIGVVVPRFAAMLTDVGQDLPPLTRIVLTAGHAAPYFAPAAGLLLIATGVLLHWITRPAGRRWWHTVLLRIPVVAGVRAEIAGARITRTLGGMLAVGMPLTEALAGAQEAGGDEAIGARLARARERVSEGAPLARALAAERVLPARTIQMLAVGDGNGQLGLMALRAGALSASDAERRVRTMVSLVEPALVVTFGAIVALVAGALLQAVYALRPGG